MSLEKKKMNEIFSNISELDWKNIVAEYVSHNIWDKIIKKFKEVIEKKSRESKSENSTPIIVENTEDEIIKNILHQLKMTYNWSKEISFKELQKSKEISESMIEPEFYLSPKNISQFPDEEKKVDAYKVVLNIDNNLIILGEPGAGKTTLSKFLSHKIISEAGTNGKKFAFPLTIRLRELDTDFTEIKNISIYTKLIEYFGFNFKYSAQKIGQFDFVSSCINRNIIEFIEELEILIILDGFDEISQPSIRKKIFTEVKQLALALDKSKLLLTSRTGDFKYSIENTKVYQICPLTKVKIKQLIGQWIKNRKESEALFNQIMKSPYADTTIRPLLLAHLCAIYEKYKKIPDRPKSVYKKVIALLLEEWDAERNVQRQSKYRNFEVDRKIEFLSNLAYILTTEFKTTVFSTNILQNCYSQICFNYELPEKESMNVIREIESHNGLVIQSGYDRFEFAHKSIQEFLTAEYLSKLQPFPIDTDFLVRIPNELAITVALSSNPNIFFATVVLNYYRNWMMSPNIGLPFLTRILLEKPDFGDNPILAYSLMYIHRKCRLSGNSESNRTLSLINTFFSLDSVKKSFKNINQYYSFPYKTNFLPKENEYVPIFKKGRGFVYSLNLPLKLYLNREMASLLIE